MSRIGKKPVTIPQGVKVAVQGNKVLVEGPKGKLTQVILDRIEVKVKDGAVLISRPSDSIKDKTYHGTMRSLINNMVNGASQGFQKRLLIEGVGFRAALQGKNLTMSLGYSHPISLAVPESVTVKVPSVTEIIVEGADKHMVGQFAAEIRSQYEPEPYKGKGIRYENEVVRRKAGKTVGAKQG